MPVQSVCTTMETKLDVNQIADIHRQTRDLGINKTLYFVKSVDSSASTEVIKSVVRECEACQCISRKGSWR